MRNCAFLAFVAPFLAGLFWIEFRLLHPDRPLLAKTESSGADEPFVFIGGLNRSAVELLLAALEPHSRLQLLPALNTAAVLEQSLGFWSYWRRIHGGNGTGLDAGLIINAQARFIFRMLTAVATGDRRPRLCLADVGFLRMIRQMHGLFPLAKFVYVRHDDGEPRPESHQIAWSCADLASACWAVSVESLVAAPEETLAEVMDFIGEAVEAAQLRLLDQATT